MSNTQSNLLTGLGEPVNVFLTFKISPDNLQEVFRRLVELKSNPPMGIVINKVVPVTGRLDAVLDVTAASPEDYFLFVSKEIGNIKGISTVEGLVGNENWLEMLELSGVTSTGSSTTTGITNRKMGHGIGGGRLESRALRIRNGQL